MNPNVVVFDASNVKFFFYVFGEKCKLKVCVITNCSFCLAIVLRVLMYECFFSECVFVFLNVREDKRHVYL